MLLALKILLTVPVAVLLAYPFFDPSSGAGVLGELSLLGPGPALLVAGAFLALVFVYCRDLSTVLSLVRPEARTAAPASVWWMFLIPYNFVEDFFIVANVARSLRREAVHHEALRARGSDGMITGLGWCAAQIVSLAPSEVGAVAGLVALPLWALHWREIRRAIALLRGPADPQVSGSR
jgi:hypothetical protein